MDDVVARQRSDSRWRDCLTGAETGLHVRRRKEGDEKYLQEASDLREAEVFK